MSRYAYHGQEVLERDGKFVGFNAGYGLCAEHDAAYVGEEQEKARNFKDTYKDHPFHDEIIKNPKAVNLVHFSDGNVWLTNDEWNYTILMKKTEEEKLKVLSNYLHNEDRQKTEENFKSLGIKAPSPSVVALWTTGLDGMQGHFDLLSTNEKSSAMLQNLYAEMQKGNVAVSSDYSFLFQDRGLSFVLIDQLTNEDLDYRRLIDFRKDMEKAYPSITKEDLEQLATMQRTESVQKSSAMLKENVENWLHPTQEIDKNIPEK